MKPRWLVLSCLLVSASAQAQLLFNTSFEQPAYTTTVLQGQQGWQADSFFTVSAARAASGAQSAMYAQPDAITQLNGAQHTLGISGTTLTATFKLYIETGPAASFFGMSLRSGNNHAASVTISAGGTVYGGGGAFALDLTHPLGSIANPMGAWHDVSITATQGSTAVGITVDAQTFTDTLNTPVGAMDGFGINAGKNTSAGPSILAYFDDVSVTAVPEPASIAALGAGLALTIRRRRRR